MGIISRFADIMKANINDLLDKCEDPEKMVEQTLRDLRNNLADVKSETAAVMAEENRAKRVLDETNEDIKKWHEYAAKALKAGNEGDARSFLAKEQEAQSKLTGAQQTYDLAHDNATKMRQMHDKLQNDINALEARKDSIKAKAAVAKTQEKINKVTAGSDASATMAKFDAMEARIDNKLNKAMAEAELNDTSDEADDLAHKYDTGQSGGSVDAALEALKAEMGM